MELTIPELVTAILVGCGIAVVAATLVSRRLRASADSRSQRNGVICRLCLHAFTDDHHTPKNRVINCPRCHTANEKGVRSRTGG